MTAKISSPPESHPRRTHWGALGVAAVVATAGVTASYAFTRGPQTWECDAAPDQYTVQPNDSMSSIATALDNPADDMSNMYLRVATADLNGWYDADGNPDPDMQLRIGESMIVPIVSTCRETEPIPQQN